MPGFQSTRLATEGALEPFLFLYTDDSIQGNPETCNQSSMMLNYEVKNSTEENIATTGLLVLDKNNTIARINESLTTSGDALFNDYHIAATMTVNATINNSEAEKTYAYPVANKEYIFTPSYKQMVPYNNVGTGVQAYSKIMVGSKGIGLSYTIQGQPAASDGQWVTEYY